MKTPQHKALDAARKEIIRSFGIQVGDKDSVYINPDGEWEIPSEHGPVHIDRMATPEEVRIIDSLEAVYALLSIPKLMPV